MQKPSSAMDTWVEFFDVPRRQRHRVLSMGNSDRESHMGIYIHIHISTCIYIYTVYIELYVHTHIYLHIIAI